MCVCRQATGGFKGSNREGLVFSLDTTKLILTQITAAIQGVHRTHTLHGDVKPDNFLVSSPYLKAAAADGLCTASILVWYR